MKTSTFHVIKNALYLRTNRFFILLFLTVLFTSYCSPVQVWSSVPTVTTFAGSDISIPGAQPCPDIVVLTGIVQPIKCVTQFPRATIDVVLTDPPNSGVRIGTVWTLSWGDGTVNVPYVSSADYDIPPIAWRQHTYSSVTDCNYIISLGIRNPCGKTYGVQFIAIVHGRDIPADGDGFLQLVNNVTGSTTIQVCAGTSAVITIRDNSTWNCQNPVVPGPLVAVPNSDPRDLEWLYGRDPVGAITNTITGAVSIATLGNAPRASGRFSPLPNTPGSLSRAITIPATCQAGQYFRVYLKNWNKCNWTDPEYVFTYVDINIIASPPAPTFGNTTFCFGSVPATITATGTGGVIRWYSNAALTTLLYTGATYTHGKTAVGNTTYYVNETLGNGCTGPATTVVLSIVQIPNQPTISRNNPDFCFNGSSSVILTADPHNPPAVTSYQWYRNGTAVAGETSSTISLSTVVQSGSYTVRTYGAAPTNCPGPLSAATTVNIWALAITTNPADASVCQGQSTSFGITASGAPRTIQWQRSINGSPPWTIITAAGTPADGCTYSNFTSATLGIANAQNSMNGFQYRAVLTTTSGGCVTTSTAADLTVYPIATVTGPVNASVCFGQATSFAITAGGAASTIQWQRSTNGSPPWTPITAAGTPADGCTYSNFTSATLGIANAQSTMNNYQYRAVLTTTTGGCTTTSGNAVLTVNALATTTNPVAASVCPGQATSFAITDGGAPRTIQWQRSTNGSPPWTNITAAGTPADGCTYSNFTSATLGIANAQSSMNGFQYRTVLTTTTGGCVATSAAAALTLYTPATTTDPVDASVCQGLATSFAITAGGAPRSIQWQRSTNGSPPWTTITAAGTPADGCTYSNFTSSTLGIANAQSLMNGFHYRAVLTTTTGSCVTTSGEAVLTVNSLATSTDPAAASVCLGLATSFAITTGGPASAIQWQRSTNGSPPWTNITAAGIPADGCTYSNFTSATLGIANAQLSMNGFQYRAVLTTTTGNCVTTTVGAALTVNPLSTTTNPAAASVCQGLATSFAITAGGAPRTIQWQRSTNGSPPWTNITAPGTPADGCTYSNYTTATLGIANAQSSMNGFQYRAVLTTNTGSCVTTSTGAVLTVNPLPVPTITGPASVCIGSTGNVYTTEPGMTNYLWVVSAGGTITSGGLPGNNTVTVTWTLAGARTVRVNYTNGNTCTATGPTVFNVAVGTLPSSATLTGSGDACFGAVSTLSSVITGGAPPYTLVIAGYAASPVNGYNSGDIINLGALAIGTHVYTLTSVTDACLSTITPGVTHTINIYPIPAGGTIISNQTICYGDDVAAFISSAAASGGVGTFTYTWQYTTNMAAVAGDGNWTDIASSNTAVYDYGTLTATTRFIRRAVDALCNTPVYSNIITVNVRPVITGGNIGNDQTICYNDDVAAFTSASPADGGAGTFTYTWQYTTNVAAVAGDGNWTNIGSSNNPVYDFGTLTANTRFIRRAVDITCTTPVYSNIITVTVRPALSGGTIGSDQTICYGNDVSAFTSGAAAVGGAGAFTYTWQYTTNMAAVAGDGNWTDIASSNSVIYDYGTLTATTRFIRRAVNVTCTAPVYTNIVTVTVRPVLSGGTIASDQTICYGDDVASFTNSVAAGGGAGTFTYTWQYTTNVAAIAGDGNWTDIGSSNSLSYDYGTLTATTRFIRRAVDITCNTPVYSNILTVTVHPQLTGGTVGSDQTICYGDDVAAFTSSASAGGGAGAFTYTWQYTTNMAAVAGDGNWTDIASSNSTVYNYGTLTATTRFIRRAVNVSCPAPVYSNILTVTVRPVLSGGTIGSNQAICFGSDVAAFTSSAPAAGGAGTFTYTWQFTTNMAAVAGDGNWTNIAASNNTIFDYGTLTSTTRFIRRAIDLTCTTPVYSNIVTVTVYPVLSGGIIGSNQANCFGNDVAPFTSSAAAGGGAGTFTYTWQYTTNMAAVAGDINWTDIGSSNSIVYDYGIITATTRFIRRAVDVACPSPVYSNIITVTVNPLPVMTFGAVPAVCVDAPAFNLTQASPAGGTYSGTGITVSPQFNPSIAGVGTHTITYTYTDGNGCTNSATMNITVVALPNTLPITGGLTNMCRGTNGQFYSIPGGPGNTYNWSVTPATTIVLGGTSGTPYIVLDFPVPGVYTLSVQEFTSAPAVCSGPIQTLTITVNPTPAVTTILSTVCSGVGFTITPLNGTNGIVPPGTTYNWSAPSGTGFTGGAAGSGATISGTLTNTTNVTQTAIYTVTPISGSCTGTDFTVIVTVDPRPAITAITSTVCSEDNFTISPVNITNGIVPSGTTYTWGVPSVTGGLTGGAAGTGVSAITATLVNPTNSAQTAIYTVTPTSGSCAGAPFSIIVSVNPKPAITAMTSSVCNGDGFTVTPVNVTNGRVPSGTTYTWTVPTVTGGLTGGVAGTGPGISGILTNSTNSPQTAIYTVTPMSGSCRGTDFTVMVIVNPKPAITPINYAVCSGIGFAVTPVNLTDGIVPAGTTYSWSAPSGTGFTGGAAGSGASNISGTLTNTTNSPQTATYIVAPISGSCTGTSFTVTVTVNPRPSVTVMNATICSGSAFTVTPANVTNGVVPAGTSYSWLAPVVTGGLTGGAAGSGTDISGILTNPTNSVQTAIYTVTPASGSCAGADFTVIVTVNPKPDISGMTGIICSGGSFTLTPANITNGIVPAGTTYSWLAPAVTGGITGGAAGTNSPTINGTLANTTNSAQTAAYTVTPTSGSCVGTDFTVIVTVNPRPAITAISSTVCSGVGFTVTPADVTNSVVPSGTTYSWIAPAVTGGLTGGAAGGGTSISGTLNNPTSLSQTAIYTVIPVSGSCTGASFTVTITVDPKPSITPMTSTVCSGVTFTSAPVNVTNGIVPAGTTYSWLVPSVTGGLTGGASGTGATISGTLVNPTNTVQTATYIVTPILGSCNGTDFTLTITVNPTPAITNMTAAICSEGTFTSTPVNITNGIVPAGTSYSWPAPVVTGGLAGGVPGTGAGITGVFTNPTNTSQTATYTVMPQSGSCIGSTFTVIVTVDPRPSITAMITTICSGDTFTASPSNVTNGVVPAGTTYTWTAPVVTGGITGGAAGVGAANISGTLINSTNFVQTATYTVIPVSGSCTGATFSVTVTVNPLPRVFIVTGPGFYCFGTSGITLTLSGSQNGVNYQLYKDAVAEGAINPGSGLALTWNNLTSGTYTVRATNPATLCANDMNGSVTVAENPDVVIISITSVSPACFGSVNGVITINASGGTGTLQYSINNGTSFQSSNVFNNLPQGTYNIIVKDARECFKTAVRVLTQPSALSVTSITITNNVTCFGGADGSARVVVAGGTPPYAYQWYTDSGFTNPVAGQVNDEATGLTAGTFWVRITDFNGCRISSSITLTQPTILNASASSTNITCFAAADGTITIAAPTGGSGIYGYSINGGAAWQPSGTFINLTPGTYNIQIRDAASISCIVTLNPSLVITQPPILAATVTQTNVSCFGGTDGVINITNPSGGYGTYQFSINGGGNWQDSQTFSGLAPGTYDVRIRDKVNIGCVIILNPALIISQPAVLTAAVNSSDVTCFGANDGTITISAPSGGSGSFGYSINGGTSWQGSGNFVNLAPGTYNIRIRDAVNIGCIIALNPPVIITQPAVLSASVVRTNVTCSGAADGTVIINGASGGYGTYEYTITGGTSWQTSPGFTGLLPGFYNVMIRDAANPACIVTLNGSLNVTEPSVLNALVARTNITCYGADNGTITISSPSGGTGTYGYSINGGTTWQGSGIFTSLIPGSYNVQIRDAAQVLCVVTLNAALVLTQPAILAATVTPTNITCFGANNGIIAITGSTGGNGTYEYSVNGGTNWSGLGNFSNLSPGIYDVRIRDAANISCLVILNPAVAITQPAILSGIVTRTNITCFGASDGTITVSNPAGGYGTYEYSINGGGSWQSSPLFTALGPGNYNVHIRDAAHPSCGIVLNNALQITQPPVLNAVVTPSNVSCNGTNDGIINITAPAGGSGTYEYSVNGGTNWSGSGLFTGLAPSIYNVQIRDVANPACVIVLNSSLTITEPALLDALVVSTNITCFGASDGSIIVSSPTGGYGSYEYSRDGGATWQLTGNFINLVSAFYNVQIRDRAHTACVAVLNPALQITQPAVLSATVTSTDVTCRGANNGTITITNPLGGYETYSWSVNGGTTWQGSAIFSNLAPGTYNVRMRDAINTSCWIVLNPALTITQPAVLSATVASTNVTCYGAADGTITITNPLGGYGTYEYTVNSGITWQSSGNFTALAPGFYNVQIRDAANIACVVVLNSSLRITEPAILSANVVSTNVTCYGANNGTISITSPFGGYGTYQYSINGGGSWQASGNYTALIPGTYNVQIRDAANMGCVIVLNPALVIIELSALNATVTPTNVSCFGASDGIIAITAPSGGSGVYQYTINGGTAWSGLGNFTNLAPSTYNVQIRDAVNPTCLLILNAALIINQPAILSATVVRTNVSCFGASDGTITISAPSGGYGTYEYSINGGGSWQAAGSFTALSPGNYNVQIRDAAHTGCVIVLNSLLGISQPPALTATVAKTEVTCSGANDGTITISSPSGGFGTYEYSINGGATWQASGNYINLIPAVYDVRIRDAANIACSVILYPNLIITQPLILTLTTTGNILLHCFGDADGMGTFYASGGNLPYSFTVTSNTTGAAMAPPGFNSLSFFSAGAGVITVIVTDYRGCLSVATINITQPPLLTAGTIAANQVICSGSNPAMITESTPASGGPAPYIYQWQYSTDIAGPFINIAGATAYQYTPLAAAGTLYYRRMVISGTCTPVYSNVIEILINPLPVAVLSGGETICPGQTSILRINLPAGTGPFTIDIANYPGLTINGYISGTDIVVSPAVTTTYRLQRVRDANGCEVLSPSAYLTGTATVVVNTLPSITSFVAPEPVCEFSLATFRVTAAGANLTYQWFVNEGAGFNPVTDGGIYFGSLTPVLQIFSSVSAMNGFIYHVVVSGCGTDAISPDAVLTVNRAPEITLHPSDLTACMGSGATLEADATGTSVTWEWYVNKGAGFVLVNNDANFSGATTKTLTITNIPSTFNNWLFRAKATGICGLPVNTGFGRLTVINPPIVTLQPLPKSTCENGSATFLGNGSGYTGMQWQLLIGAVWTDLHDDPVYFGTTSGQMAILDAPLALNGRQYRLSITGSCGTVYTNAVTLTVYANPVVSFPDTINACGAVPIVINGNPTGGSGVYTQHRWTGDVGPLNSYIIQSPTFNSPIAGNYNLNYRVTDNRGCSANDDVVVKVDSPSAQYTRDINNGCTPLSVAFTKDMTGISKFWWDFNDGSPVDSVNASLVHLFTNANSSAIGYYDVKLKVRSAGGCITTFTSVVTVYPKIDATFTASPAIVCSGSQVVFTSVPGASKYFWDFGDGTSGYLANLTSHLYTNITAAPVVYQVKLTTTSFYSCTDTKTFSITVMPVPAPQFSAVPVLQIFNVSGNPVTFTNETNAGTWNWVWKFGDGATSAVQNPVHNYTVPGEFTVTLIARNANCSDSVKHKVSVLPQPPVANFDSIQSGCAPLKIIVNNTSLHTEIPGTTYKWDFGDGATSTSKNPEHIYMDPGTYRISLIVTGPGGVSSKSQIINVFITPLADFRISKATVIVNDEIVRFFNLSLDADYYLWDFGDGDTSTVRDPFHKYMKTGEFDITLWAYSNNGCASKFVMSPGVTALPSGVVRFATVFTPNKDGPIERSDLPTGGTEIDQFFFPPIREEVTDYKLQIFNRLGVLIFEAHDINKPWNGYYRGKLCPQGVYVWYVEGKYLNKQPFKMVGDVTLLH